MKLFSITSFREKLKSVFLRFPIALLLLTGFSVLLSLENDAFFFKLQSDEIPYSLWIFCSIGTIISIAATLGLENITKWVWRYGLNLVAVLLWGAYCLFLPSTASQVHLDTDIQLGILGAAFVVASFFISFLKRNQNMEFWVFSKRLITQLFLSALFGMILYAGLALALYSIDSLFTEVSKHVYDNLEVACLSLFSPIYFLANIPAKMNKYDNELSFNRAFKILGLYILLPLLGVYTLILYVYLLKIIFTWELPNGWVSTLVSILAIGGLLTILLLYPLWMKKENKVALFVSRYFGLLIFPLLCLMSVGILRRIHDYGITINRCYVLILNLWFYGIFIYLFLTKSKPIRWILISPTVIFLLVSIGPWSISNVTKHTISNKLEKTLHQLSFLTDGKISLTESPQFFASLEKQKKTDIGESLKYLGYTYGMESLQPFFRDSIQDEYVSEVVASLGLNSNEYDDLDLENGFRFEVREIQFSEINKYNSLIQIDFESYDNSNKMINYAVDSNAKHIVIKNNQDNREFTVPIRQDVQDFLKTKKSEAYYTPIYFSDTDKKLMIKGDDYILYITEIRGDYNKTTDSLTISALEGLLFYK